MTMATAIGAVSSEAAEWYAMDWQAIHRNGPRNLGHTRKEDTGSTCISAQRLSTSASPTCLHIEIGQENDAPSGNPDGGFIMHLPPIPFRIPRKSCLSCAPNRATCVPQQR